MAALVLPWPSTALSPNARVNWRRRGEAAKRARGEAAMLARSARVTVPAEGALSVSIEARPPKGWRTGDVDNMLARLKPVLDGIAEGLGVNDRRFRPSLRFGERCQGGEIVITVEALE